MMQKIWYIKINGKQEGPFSVEDLKKDFRLTPDTLAWREGFEKWKPLGEIDELKTLFQDEDNSQEAEPSAEEKEERSSPQEEIVLEMGEEPPYFFWILITAIVIIYVLAQLYWK